MPYESQYRTFQTPLNYEAALGRHGQWLRWVQGVTCPCLNSDTAQADPQCTLCKGRGKIYRSPERFHMLNEKARHDSYGRVYPLIPPMVVNSATVYRKGVPLALEGVQPPSGAYAQLAEPHPMAWEIVTLDYDWSPAVSVVAENSEVYSTNVLRTIATRFITKSKSFESSIKAVTRVYNVTKDYYYPVARAEKEFIYLTHMGENGGTWEPGDVLEVDYTYIRPFNFLLVGVSPRLRWEQPYVLEEADAVLVTPYWAQVAPDDLFTAMAMEQIGRAVVDPKVSLGNDEITAYFDLSRLLRVIGKNGTEYTVGPGNNVEIVGRNELRWNITKPSVPYTAQFTYHPTYTALTSLQGMRNAENKAFVNRISLRQFDHVHAKVTY